MRLKWKDDTALRELAEERLSEIRGTAPVVADPEILPYELSVHKEELRMQQEALLEALDETRDLYARYRELFDNAPVGYLVLDGMSRITAANARASVMLGETPVALVGKRFAKFLSSNDAVSFDRYRREVARSEEALTAEFTILTGRTESRELRLEGLCTNRLTGEWRVALMDVSAYNALLRRLDHGGRLGAFERHASTVAHDLNNLHYSISLHAEVALALIEPGSKADAALRRLKAVVNRCATATEQLTAFSRAEDRPPSTLDLNAELLEMEPLLRALLGDNVELELALSAEDAFVRLNTSHVEQMLLTSAKNSRQAMAQGGTYRVATANIELNSDGPLSGHSGRFVLWSMSDTGIGMDEATRRHAFEPFFTTKPPGVGTGLGLAMLKGSVERAGGFVTLESEPGHGTRLSVYLPRATGTRSNVPPPLATDESSDGTG